MEFTIDMTQIVIAIVGIVFSAIIIPLGKVLYAFGKAKIQLIKDENLRKIANAAYDEASFVATNVVTSLQASLVSGLKASAPDGKLTAEQVKDVTCKAIKMFISDLSAGSMKVIEDNADDVEAWITNLIKTKVEQIKL